MWSLVFRNLFFTILQPGVVAGLLPYWILGSQFSETFKNSISFFQYIAIFIFTAGIAILFYCIGLFVVKGKGTLSPADPTKKLVVSGLYKFSRNPMYIGVILMLMGEAIFFSSSSLWIYSAIVFIAFHLFIIFHEEPRLNRVFGTEYHQYQKTVRRWL
jgi:protein-S-isoprenylcysteine O-methyltransferase Ste14